MRLTRLKNGAKVNNIGTLDLQQIIEAREKVQDVVRGHSSSLLFRGGSPTRRGPSKSTPIETDNTEPHCSYQKL